MRSYPLRSSTAPRRWYLGFVILLSLGAPRSSPAVAGEEPAARDAVLAVLRERNVFDPNRRAQRRDEPGEREAPPQTESFVLTGALLHDGTALGFFDGSRPEYRRVLSTGESLAGYSVVEIATSGVTLEKDGSQVQLAVGMSLRRVGEGEWTLAAERYEAPGSSAAPPGPSPVPPPDAAVGSAPSDEKNDILRRMMERRRQEDSR